MPPYGKSGHDLPYFKMPAASIIFFSYAATAEPITPGVKTVFNLYKIHILCLERPDRDKGM